MPADNLCTVLLLGDVYGAPGCRALFFGLPVLKKQYNPDLVVVNGENASSGLGINAETLGRFFTAGVDVITSGNHIWQQEDVLPLLDSEQRLLRPANYPQGNPGHGMAVVNSIAVINLQGRQNMPMLDCPFKTGAALAREARRQTPLVFVDFHAESTAEKEALGFRLDGLITALVGTHTHVQTADEKILPKKTAYITDIGMCGVAESVIGSDPEVAVIKQKTQMPYKPMPTEGDAVLCGVLIKADRATGEAVSIQRIRYGA